MRIGRLLPLGAAMLITCQAAHAQELITGNSVDAILAAAQSYGQATLDRQANGDPQIRGAMLGVGYSIYFRNCTDNTDCEDLNFYCGILDHKASADAINEWNRTRRFGKAYLDNDGDTVVEMDLNIEGGVSAENLDAAFGVWEIVLSEFTSYVGYDPTRSGDDA